MPMITKLAKPTNFKKLSAVLLPVFAVLSTILIGAGLYFAFFNSPPDYQQGNTVRIMYVHVPAAWMALFTYTAMAIASLIGLVWRHRLAEVFTKSAAPIGACFTAICLITGSLWGEPMWGTWWVWDARLTSMLILFFLYLGYILLVDAFDDGQRGLQAGSILILVGFVNIPVIKFSVDWWNTLHQPCSILRLDGPTIHGDMLIQLFLMIGGFTALMGGITLMRMKTELLRAQIHGERIRSIQAEVKAHDR